MHPIDRAIQEMQARRQARTCVTVRMSDLARLETAQLHEIASARQIPTVANRRDLMISLFRYSTQYGLKEIFDERTGTNDG